MAWVPKEGGGYQWQSVKDNPAYLSTKAKRTPRICIICGKAVMSPFSSKTRACSNKCATIIHQKKL